MSAALSDFVPLPVLQVVGSLLCALLAGVIYQQFGSSASVRQPSRKSDIAAKQNSATTPNHQAERKVLRKKRLQTQRGQRAEQQQELPQSQPHALSHQKVEEIPEQEEALFDAHPELPCEQRAKTRQALLEDGECSAVRCSALEVAETEADTATLEEPGTPRLDGADSESAGTEHSGEANWMPWEDVIDFVGASKPEMPFMGPEGEDPHRPSCQYIPVLVKVDPSAEELDHSMFVKVNVHPKMEVFTPRNMMHVMDEGSGTFVPGTPP